MRSFRVPLAILAFAALASTATAQSVSNFEFAQVDWYAPDDTLTLADSSWGAFTMDVLPHPTDTWFFNLAGDSGGSPAWLIQNLPIFPENVLESGRRGVDFDIADLGVAEGVDLSSIAYTWALSAVPQVAPPAGGSTFAAVSSLQRKADGAGTSGDGQPIGRPLGKKVVGGPTNVIAHRTVPEVQEGRIQCLPGSIARSLSWLNGRFLLGDPRSAQQTYGALALLNVGTYSQRLAAFQTHWLTIDAGATFNVLDLTGIIDLTAIPAVNGLQEVVAPLPDLVDWIYQEFPKRGMEIDYTHNQGDHIVTLAGIYRQGGKVYILFRDDVPQGDDTKGDKAVQHAELRMVGGQWRFRTAGNGFRIRLALSHSATDRLIAFCAGDGLDGNVAPCPCANFGSPGRGCSNSVNGAGALLDATGDPYTDDVALHASGMPSTTSCIFLQGTADSSSIFGDGVRCASGAILRLRTRTAVGGAASFPDSTDTITLSARGAVIPGTGVVRYYQTYYRNASAAYCPPATFNITNGMRATW